MHYTYRSHFVLPWHCTFLTLDSFAIVQICQCMHSELAKQSKTAPIPQTLPVFEDGMLVVRHAEIFMENFCGWPFNHDICESFLSKFPVMQYIDTQGTPYIFFRDYCIHPWCTCDINFSCVYMYSICICQLYCYIYCYFCFYTQVYCIQCSQFHWIQWKWMHLQFRVNLLTLLHLTKQVRFGIFSSAFHPINLNM